MSADQRIVTERVQYAGQAYRICSQAHPEPGEIVTTLERGEAVLMSKNAPYNATMDSEGVDRVLALENRRVRERLLAGDLDLWLSASPDVSPAVSPAAASVAVGRRAPARRPGRWAVKVGMVEKPFRTPAPSPPEPAAESARPKADLPRHLGPYCLVEAAGPERFLAFGGGGTAERLVLLRTFAHASSELLDDARSLLRIEHGALAPVVEVGMADETLLVATTVCEGRDAHAMIRRSAELARPLPLDAVAWMVREVARALGILHGEQRVHGAIAPDVVQVGWGGEIRLGGLVESLGRKESPTAGDDIAALGTLLLALLGRSDGTSAARAPFVPPALLQIATRSAREGAGQSPLRSAQAVDAALTTFLVHDAPRTDAPRVARILAELFPDSQNQDGVRKSELLERARKLPRPEAQASAAVDRDTTTPPIPSIDPRATDVERPTGSIVDGRYRLNRMCGRGGMGWVYEAEHQGIGKRVALKILHPFYSRSADISERFRREARAASKIGHPHIADVFDFGTTEDGCLYIAMEFLEGFDLGQLLEEEAQLPVKRALRITEQVCRALDAAHNAGVVHRDLKPENVFLLQDDFVKVLDFGIAKYVEEPKEERLTRPNIALGTPEYMAPEQVAGKVEPRSDIYAVGAMLYEMLVGGPPFEGENYLEVFRRKALEDPIAPSALRDDVPREVDALVLRALAQKPEDRQSSMATMAEEISALVTSIR